jgi:low affinity Fe/Cu permease
MNWLARHAAIAAGSAWFFALSCILTVAWFFSGFWIGFTDAWNFWANTSTTVLTWLLVILLQNTQNRDTLAVQAKLDQLIAAIPQASNRVIGMEELPEAEQEQLRQEIGCA